MAAGNSATAYYSTTARTGVAYRVVGYVESTQATAGTWATTPSTLQGYGGQALAAMSSLGYGQTWQTVTRAFSTTYYNTTGKPISIWVYAANVQTGYPVRIVVAGINLDSVTSAATSNVGSSAIVPPGASYSASLNGGTGTVSAWTELR